MTTAHRWRLLTLLLLASLVACDDCDDRQFPTEPSDPEEAPLELTTQGGALTLPADGFSTLQITAKVNGQGLKPTLVVRFRTTAGTFVGTTTAESAFDVSLDGTGKAIAVLRSSTRTGPVLVSAQIIDGTTAQPVFGQLQLEFVLPDASGFRFVEGAASAPADGATVTRFTVQVPAAVPLDQRTVTFKTSLGSFDGAMSKSTTVPAGPDGQASILLYSPIEDGLALLSAAVSPFDIETLVFFRPAPAETILVSAPARLEDKPTNTEVFKVTATLVRRIGTPTAGTVVSFLAFDKNNQRFGAFHNVTLSSNTGVSTAEFRPAGTGEPGNCRLEVRAEGSSAVGRAEFLLVR